MVGEFIRLILHWPFLYTVPKYHLLGSAAQAGEGGQSFVLALHGHSYSLKQKRKEEIIMRL